MDELGVVRELIVRKRWDEEAEEGEASADPVLRPEVAPAAALLLASAEEEEDEAEREGVVEETGDSPSCRPLKLRFLRTLDMMKGLARTEEVKEGCYGRVGMGAEIDGRRDEMGCLGSKMQMKTWGIEICPRGRRSPLLPLLGPQPLRVYASSSLGPSGLLRSPTMLSFLCPK